MLDELALAQDRLGRTLERTRASEDRELAGRVRDEGYQLVHQLNGLLRMSRLHSLDNHAFDKPVRDLAHGLERLTELLGTLTLAVVEDQVYLNEIRIRLDESQEGAPELGAELVRHGLGGLRFHGALSEPELRRLVACFAVKPGAVAPRAALRKALQREGLTGLELLGRFRVRLAANATSLAGHSDGRDTLARCAQAVTDAFDNLGSGRLFNPLPARRAVAKLLAAERDAEMWLSLELPGVAPHVAHAVRVCRFALRLGREIGLAHGVLQDLGVAALLHDVGYAEVRPEGSRRQAEGVRHASAGARLLLRQRGFHVSKVRRVRAVLGHHAPMARRRRPSLLSRILHIAEDYDTLVERGGASPQSALGGMIGGAGTAYDPLLLQAFVNALAPSGMEAAPPPPRPALLELTESPALTLVEPAVPLSLSVEAPPIEGKLAQGVPIRLIHDAHLERSGGRLTFESETESCALHFVDGAVVAVWSSRLEHSLEAQLLGSGLIRPAQLEWAQKEAARTGHPLGRTLAGAGLVETEGLEQALAAQARVVVSTLVEWDDGRYRFVPDEGLQAEEDEGHSISTDGLIVAAVRALHDPDVIRFALGDLDRVPLRSADRAPRAAESLLGPAESGLLERVDGSSSARRLLQEAGQPPPAPQRALLTLLALGLVDYRTY
jgi:hypothetical protein